MTNLMAPLWFFVLFFSPASSLPNSRLGSVFYDETAKEYSFSPDWTNVGSSVAHGWVQDTVNELGFESFYVYTNGAFDDDIQSFAAGYLEGLLQGEMMSILDDVVLGMYQGSPPSPLSKYMEDNYNWVQSQPSNDYFNMVRSLFAQQDGIRRGFNEINTKNYSLAEFLSIFDSDAIGAYFAIPIRDTQQRRRSFSVNIELDAHGSPRPRPAWVEGESCTALIKLLPDRSDLFFGHNLWFDYSLMALQWKEYHFSFSNPSVKSQTIYETGWAGVIDSAEHFMLTESGLAITETSLSTYNHSIAYPPSFVGYESVFTVYRSVVAARFSTSVTEWFDTFSKYNSGTFNSNWFILNMKLFEVGHDLPVNSVLMVEQMPGVIAHQDVTSWLNSNGYLASYNVAHFPEIRDKSGVTWFVETHVPASGKDIFDWEKCPRAKIAKRDHESITDLQSFKKVLRGDRWKDDPLSLHDSQYSLCSRPEITAGAGNCFGCLDGKAISVRDWKERKAVEYVVSPPHEHTPVFKWSETACKGGSSLLPNEFSFPWVSIQAGASSPPEPKVTPSLDLGLVLGISIPITVLVLFAFGLIGLFAVMLCCLCLKSQAELKGIERRRARGVVNAGDEDQDDGGNLNKKLLN